MHCLRGTRVRSAATPNPARFPAVIPRACATWATAADPPRARLLTPAIPPACATWATSAYPPARSASHPRDSSGMRDVGCLRGSRARSRSLPPRACATCGSRSLPPWATSRGSHGIPRAHALPPRIPSPSPTTRTSRRHVAPYAHARRPCHDLSANSHRKRPHTRALFAPSYPPTTATSFPRHALFIRTLSSLKQLPASIRRHQLVHSCSNPAPLHSPTLPPSFPHPVAFIPSPCSLHSHASVPLERKDEGYDLAPTIWRGTISDIAQPRRPRPRYAIRPCIVLLDSENLSLM
jgi:hypothetical protein